MINNNVYLLNDFFKKNYGDREEFFNDLPHITPQRLISFLELASDERALFKNRYTIDQVVYYLNAKVCDGSLAHLARRIESACAFFVNSNVNHQVRPVIPIQKPHAKKVSFVTEKKHLVEIYTEDDPNQESVFIAQGLLESASGILRDHFKKDEQFAKNIPIMLENVSSTALKYFKEFLETGKIDQSSKPLSPEHLRDLAKFASMWEITTLMPYILTLGLVKIDNSNFEEFLYAGYKTNNGTLFKLCFKFDGVQTIKLLSKWGQEDSQGKEDD